MRTGIGFDFHRLIPGDGFFLGGTHIPFEKSCKAHSDGDVLIHAIIDALLGAAAMADIGAHFSDESEEWENASGIDLLARTKAMLDQHHYSIGNIDSVVILEKPKLQLYLPAITVNISDCLKIPSDQVSVKAKTAEQSGIIGMGEGIAALATVLIEKNR